MVYYGVQGCRILFGVLRTLNPKLPNPKHLKQVEDKLSEAECNSSKLAPLEQT